MPPTKTSWTARSREILGEEDCGLAHGGAGDQTCSRCSDEQRRGGCALTAERTLELANKAYSLYVSQDAFEKAKLPRMLLPNCSIGAVSATSAYKFRFNLIFERAKTEKWSALVDDFRTVAFVGNRQEMPR